MSDDASLHLSDPLPFPRQFASKVDWWLAAVLFSPLVLVGLLVLSGMSEPWVLLLVLAPQLLVTWIITRTHYSVGEDVLVARSGPFRFAVPIASIRSLTASRSARSSPAMSLDRIAVEHTSGRLLVSPRNKAGFVRAVLAVAPSVTISGLPGSGPSSTDEPESTFNSAAVVPLVVLATVGIAFGGWQFYAGTRAPETTVSDGTLSISGLYSTTVSRQDVVRIAIEDRIVIGQKRQGFDGGRYRRGIFDVEGLGQSRVFVSRDATPFLVNHTKTQPLVINFDDPARTRDLHEELLRTWRLGG